jgi:putative ABC transport system permease protein
MKALAALKSFARACLLRSRMEREMDDEMRFHVDARAADLERRGVARAEAQRRAQREFGDLIRWKEAGRESRGVRLVDDVRADLRYAVRTMRRAPGFTASAVVSLALGIGASTAVFGLMDLLLLRPLAVRSPHELVHVTTAGERGSAESGSSNVPWYREVASRTDLFADAMLVRHDLYKVSIGGRVEPVTGQRVTTNYYNLLGVPAILGRTFVPADRPETGGSPVAVISYGFWQRHFGGDPDVIGTSITVDQQPYTVVGVTPPEFGGILVGWTMDVTMPLDSSEFMDPHNWSTTPLIARLNPDVDIARVGVLLLITCVNIAGLLVARNATRQHELGVRLAVGASRRRIVRQLLTESALLALLGAVPGVLLATYGGNLLLAFMPPFFGPVSLTVAADWRVLTFALSMTVATTVLFGLVPAWQATRIDGSLAMNRASSRTSTTRGRVGRTLVVVQTALSLVLVAGAALLLRTLVHLSRVDTGFDRRHVLVVQMDPQGTSYDGDRLRVFQREMLAALAGLAGVEHVSLATSSPFNGNMDGRRLTVPGVEPRDPDDRVIQVNLIGADYFDVFGVPILRGRPIDTRDQAGTARVAVVSESFARRYFGDAGAAIGRQFTIGRGESAIEHEIVGVARDVRYQRLRTTSERMVYLPWFQAHDVRLAPFEFVIRTTRDPANWINITRNEMLRLRPDAPIFAIHTMTGVINGHLRSERLLATLGSFFAVVALTLAAVGVYGLLAYVVACRVPEIGVRLALGARPQDMVWMTLRENLRLALIGSGVGIAAAAGGLRTLEGLLFGLSPTDVVNLGTAALILVLVSLAAAVVPARRAASVDPLVVLRNE